MYHRTVGLLRHWFFTVLIVEVPDTALHNAGRCPVTVPESSRVSTFLTHVLPVLPQRHIVARQVLRYFTALVEKQPILCCAITIPRLRYIAETHMVLVFAVILDRRQPGPVPLNPLTQARNHMLEDLLKGASHEQAIPV